MRRWFSQTRRCSRWLGRWSRKILRSSGLLGSPTQPGERSGYLPLRLVRNPGRWRQLLRRSHSCWAHSWRANRFLTVFSMLQPRATERTCPITRDEQGFGSICRSGYVTGSSNAPPAPVALSPTDQLASLEPDLIVAILRPENLEAIALLGVDRAVDVLEQLAEHVTSETVLAVTKGPKLPADCSSRAGAPWWSLVSSRRSRRS